MYTFSLLFFLNGWHPCHSWISNMGEWVSYLDQEGSNKGEYFELRRGDFSTLPEVAPLWSTTLNLLHSPKWHIFDVQHLIIDCTLPNGTSLMYNTVNSWRHSPKMAPLWCTTLLIIDCTPPNSTPLMHPVSSSSVPTHSAILCLWGPGFPIPGLLSVGCKM